MQSATHITKANKLIKAGKGRDAANRIRCLLLEFIEQISPLIIMLNKIGFVSPERRYEAPGCCTAAAKVIIIMGKDAGFSWFPNRSVAINSRENRVKPLSNIYKQRLTVSKHATNETKYSVLRRVRAQRDCPRRHAFANYLI